MAAFMRMKYENPKLKQSEIENRIGYSSSTLQRYRNDVNMLLLYRIHQNNTNKRTKASNTSFDNNSHPNHDVKRSQKTPNDFSRRTQTNQLKI